MLLYMVLLIDKHYFKMIVSYYLTLDYVIMLLFEFDYCFNLIYCYLNYLIYYCWISSFFLFNYIFL